MADYVPKTNTARIFPNKYRNGNDKAPQYKGDGVIEITGRVAVSAWVNYNDDKTVKNVFLSFSEPYEKDNAAKSTARTSGTAGDEIPF